MSSVIVPSIMIVIYRGLCAKNASSKLRKRTQIQRHTVCSCWLNAYQFLHIALMTNRFLKKHPSCSQTTFVYSIIQNDQRTSCLSVCVSSWLILWFLLFGFFFHCFFLFIQFYESKVRRECGWRSLFFPSTFRSVGSSIIYFEIVWLFITGFFLSMADLFCYICARLPEIQHKLKLIWTSFCLCDIRSL